MFVNNIDSNNDNGKKKQPLLLNYVKYLLKAKGIGFLPRRTKLILRGFGISVKKSDKNMINYIQLLQKYNCKPTLFVTGILINRYPYFLKKYQENETCFAGHGLFYIDHTQLSLSIQSNQFTKLIKLFSTKKINIKGFRSPYLKSNSDTFTALKSANYVWCSNQVVLWAALTKHNYKNSYWTDYQRSVSDIYPLETAEDFVPLPSYKYGVLDFPISIPDDELLIDRLRIKKQEMIFAVWKYIFDTIRDRGGLYVHLTHHERILNYNEALSALMQYIIHSEHPVWVATLDEIYEWWNERNEFSCIIENAGSNEYSITIQCSSRATVLIKKASADTTSAFDNYTIINERSFTYNGQKKPVIGVAPGIANEFMLILQTLGFIYEISSNKEEYEIFFNNNDCAHLTKESVLKIIQSSEGTVLRLWYWPDGFRSAYSATSDVDSITLQDFILRAREFHGNVLASQIPRKIWIDLDNTPHVPFFKPIIQALHAKGLKTVITARDRFQLFELADKFGLSYKKIGRDYGKIKIKKVFGLMVRAAQLIPFLIREKPDLAISHGSRSQLIIAFFLRIPTVLIFDYEHAKGFPIMQPDNIIIPEVISDKNIKMNKNHLFKYPGIKENVYVSNLKPDAGIRSSLGISENDLLITIRPPATEAHYFTPASQELFEETVDYLGYVPGVRLVILSRNKTQVAFIKQKWAALCAEGKIVMPEQVVDGLNLLWHSDIVISGGGTINREAAALGVPVYSIFRGKIGDVDRYLSETGRLVLIENKDDLRSKINLQRKERSNSPIGQASDALKTIVQHLVTIAER